MQRVVKILFFPACLFWDIHVHVRGFDSLIPLVLLLTSWLANHYTHFFMGMGHETVVGAPDVNTDTRNHKLSTRYKLGLGNKFPKAKSQVRLA